MRIAETLNSFRKRIGYTQAELAKKSGLTQAYISAIELGNKEPSKETIQKISEAFGLSADVIVIYAAELSDIPDYKKQSFDIINGSMRKLIDELVDICAEERRLDKEYGMK